MESSVNPSDDSLYRSMDYVLVGDMVLAQTGASDNTLYLLPDAQNSTRMVSDAGGAVTSQYDYDAFGNLAGDLDPLSLETSFLYTGQQFDGVYTKLYNLRARQYDPSVGRFLSRDTWAYDYNNPFELNRYVYTANNPVNWSDPSGHTVVINYSITKTLIAVKNFVIANQLGITIGAAVLLPVFALFMLQERVGDYVNAPTGDYVASPQEILEAEFPNWFPGSGNGSPDGNEPGGSSSPWGSIIKSAIATGTILILCALLCPKDDGDPEPDPSPQPATTTPTPSMPTPTPTREPGKTVVELGAGDYSNAINNKTLHPDWDMWATNQHDTGNSLLLNGGNPTNNIELQAIMDGFNTASQLGIHVGQSVGSPYTNADISTRSADIVYVIAPWTNPAYGQGAYDMGRSAAMIAKLDTGTQIYVSGDNYSVPPFKRGVDSLYTCNWREDFPNRFGASAYLNNLTTAFTCER